MDFDKSIKDEEPLKEVQDQLEDIYPKYLVGFFLEEKKLKASSLEKKKRSLLVEKMQFDTYRINPFG